MKYCKVILLRFIGLFFITASLFTSGCKDMYEDQTFMAYEELPIAHYLKSQEGEFSLWVELIEHAGLFNTLNINTIYTCFVPTNDAVNRYLSNNGISSVLEIAKEDAAYLVKYHMIHGVAFDLGQFQSGAINELNETDDNLSIDFRDGGLDAIYLNGEARMLKFD